MAITLGTEISLPIHLDQAQTYTAIEAALTDAGFTDYTIIRQVNYDGSGDAQVFVRSALNEDGSREPLPASQTLLNLADALVALEQLDPAPAPSPDEPVTPTPSPDEPVTPEDPAQQPDSDNA